MKEKVIKYKKKEEGKIVCILKYLFWELEFLVVILELKGLVIEVL